METCGEIALTTNHRPIAQPDHGDLSPEAECYIELVARCLAARWQSRNAAMDGAGSELAGESEGKSNTTNSPPVSPRL